MNETIFSLLAKKHEKDVFVPECKNGPTWTSRNLLIMDAWVMRKSWQHPLVTVYEIKNSHQDFTQDQKWPGYLKYCNEFYFACPQGLIQPNELSAEVGLYWASKNMKKLYLKKKAAHRRIEIPTELYIYIIMCRAKIDNEIMINKSSKAYWEQWLKNKQIDREFGYHLRGKIADRIDEEILNVRKENTRLAEQISRFERIERVLEQLGLDITKDSRFYIENKIRNLPSSQAVLQSIDGLMTDLARLKKEIEKEGEKINIAK